MEVILRLSAVVAVCFAVSACVSQPIDYKATGVVTEASYLDSKSTNGIVLLDVNWGRWWGCGGHANAQLISLAFDKLPVSSGTEEVAPALVIHSPSRVFVDPVFLNYAFSLEPGEYALSALSIKVADESSNVGFLTAKRDRLFSDGKPVGGTFTVNPRENVFIGNFYLDCTYGPTLWRYHSDGRDAFEAHVEEYSKSFPFLELDDVQFRLFKTEMFGNDYELPGEADS